MHKYTTESTDCTTPQQLIFVFIEDLVARYGEAFPSMATMAKAAQCSQYEAAQAIRELCAQGRVRKEQRFGIWDGRRGKLSNRYVIVEPAEETQPVPAVTQNQETQKTKVSRNIKAFIKDFKKPLKTDDEYNILRQREVDPVYLDWFYEIATKYRVPKPLADEILPHVLDDLLAKKVKWPSLDEAFFRMTQYAKGIHHFPSWFKETLKNVQISLDLDRIGAENMGLFRNREVSNWAM